MKRGTLPETLKSGDHMPPVPPVPSSMTLKLHYCNLNKAAFTRDFGTVLYGTVPRRYG